MIKNDDVFRIGKIGKAHALKGELQMLVDDDVFDRVEADYVVLQIDGLLVPFFIEEYRFRSDETALIKFCDIDTAEQARRLTGCEVFFPRALADADGQGMTYAELVGYTVMDTAGNKPVGVIRHVDDTTENILFELDNGILLPAPDEFIDDINRETLTVTMTFPQGLLEMN